MYAFIFDHFDALIYRLSPRLWLWLVAKMYWAEYGPVEVEEVSENERPF